MKRPTLETVPVIILVSLYVIIVLNRTFWRKGAVYLDGHEYQLAALGTALFLLMTAALVSLSVKFVVKPLLIFVILVSAVASYFVDSFGIMIDREMIANVALTTSTEAGQLLTSRFLLHLVAYGLLPSALLLMVKIEHRTWWAKFRQNSLVVFPSLLVSLALTLLCYPAFSSTFRNHGDLLGTFNPAAPLVATVKYVKRQMAERDIVAKPLGTDAHPGERATASRRPMVTVVVIGETARALNFGLNGYSRDTTPELRTRGVTSFRNVSSCGTSTAVSVPCMFSNLTRAGYSSSSARSSENVTDVLQRGGAKVSWFDNDTGSMGVAARVPYEFLPDSYDPRFCRGGECLDDILVDRLRGELTRTRGDTVIVLHQLGSHGPSYYRRYPDGFRTFRPDCRTAEFADCKREEIVNAYDNTILYTDHVLAEIVDLLNSRPDLASSMLYVSDHGESLGENGIYLHAMPYFMAPSTQTHVPMIAWFSGAYKEASGLDGDCVTQLRDQPLSHDNLFHTLLGLADVATQVYDAKLDAFAACRSRPGEKHLAFSMKGASR
ncbi:phosphoethanolamine transferase [Mangrovicella endophytica]|uniref:phosphoethanolamine transferase n=1 Tax=Mangrovicella endophytica TaxID=2066697 RepID=UPI000C9E51F5|nr:phosphoethanolamine--lipid A transferase [Mangrovicella endophytica]